jgi:hypothetical protein
MRVRLVKGAYWDTEIKRAQVAGLPDYSVFTRKANTDLSYLAAAQKLLALRDRIHPMFGTHNALTVAAVLDMASVGGNRAGNDEKAWDFEFQRLHGMGEALHEKVLADCGVPVTIYAGKWRKHLFRASDRRKQGYSRTGHGVYSTGRSGKKSGHSLPAPQLPDSLAQGSVWDDAQEFGGNRFFCGNGKNRFSGSDPTLPFMAQSRGGASHQRKNPASGTSRRDRARAP